MRKGGTMNKYKKYIKKNWYCFLLGPVFMTLEAAGEFILPFINANIIDRGAANRDIPYILQNGLYMLLIAGVLGAFFAIRGSSRIAAGVRQDTFDQIQTFTQSLLRGGFRSPVMLVSALIMSFMLNPDIAWVILVIVPVLDLVTFLIIKMASPRYTIMKNQLDRLNTGIGETITNERVITSFVREEYEKDKFSAINGSLMDKTISALKMMILMQPISALAINVTTLIVVWIAGRQIIIGGMEVGTLTPLLPICHRC